MAEVVKISDALKIDVTALRGHSTEALVPSHRLTDTELARLERVAAAPLPTLPPCDARHFDQCLRIMIAALPRQSSDELGGELLVAAYRRKLGHMPTDQINFVTDKALERCRWFPTIMECLEIAMTWQRNDDALRQQQNAVASIGCEKQARMDEAMTAMEAGTISQPEIDALPPRWQSIAETRSLLRRLDDGSYVLRLHPVPRDSDASLAEDPQGLSGEAVAARAEGIAQGPAA